MEGGGCGVSGGNRRVGSPGPSGTPGTISSGSKWKNIKSKDKGEPRRKLVAGRARRRI